MASGSDFVESFRRWRLWLALAINDIASRYRGSVLGPFWITLTTIALVLGIGVVYGDLMRVPVDTYVPWMATGIVLWNLILQMISEGSTAYVEGSGIIQSTSTPLPVFIWRIVTRAVINFLHQLPVVIGVAVYFGYILDIHPLMTLVGLVLVLLNITWMGFAAAIISARFRDVQQVITSVMQMVFFLSPVIWIPRELSGVTELLKINPVYHMLAVTRDPLLGQTAALESYVYLLILMACGWVATFMLYAFVRRRIVHYL